MVGKRLTHVHRCGYMSAWANVCMGEWLNVCVCVGVVSVLYICV